MMQPKEPANRMNIKNTPRPKVSLEEWNEAQLKAEMEQMLTCSTRDAWR